MHWMSECFALITESRLVSVKLTEICLSLKEIIFCIRDSETQFDTYHVSKRIHTGVLSRRRTEC